MIAVPLIILAVAVASIAFGIDTGLNLRAGWGQPAPIPPRPAAPLVLELDRPYLLPATGRHRYARAS